MSSAARHSASLGSPSTTTASALTCRADDDAQNAALVLKKKEKVSLPTPRWWQIRLALSSSLRAFSACAARTDSTIDGAPYTADPARAVASLQ